jgi:hypothetical protein
MKFGVDLLARDAFANTHDNAVGVVVPGTDGDRSVDVGVLPGEANGEHADDGIELVVEA